jgi:MYXO-CTERM domain-containing protein
MNISSSIAVVGSMALTAAAAAGPTQSFGTLSYPTNGGTQISWVWPIGGGSDNTNFVFTNTNIGSGGTDKWLTIGLRANAYYGAPNAIPTYVGNNTFEADAGASLWAPAPGDPVPAAYANAPRWGFSWNISVNGSRDASALTGLYWSMRIVGPGSSGNWGTTASSGPIGANDALNAWQLGFNFFPLSSGATPINPASPSGPFYPANLWDGLNFNRNTLGDYQFEIAVRGGQTGTILGSTSMTVSVVPAPGAIALLGLAGLSVRRRRN